MISVLFVAAFLILLAAATLIGRALTPNVAPTREAIGDKPATNKGQRP